MYIEEKVETRDTVTDSVFDQFDKKVSILRFWVRRPVNERFDIRNILNIVCLIVMINTGRIGVIRNFNILKVSGV